MAFDYTKFQKSTQSDSPSVNVIWIYTKTDEAIAAITVDGYFDAINGIVNGVTANDVLKVGDIIWVVASDAQSFISVDDISPTIATSEFSVVLGADSVGTINIVDGAVTAAKIANLTITNADVAAGAAIDYSKLAPLPSGDILVGSNANVPTARAVTGDITLSNTGVTAIAAGAIVDADINAAAAIEFSKLAPLNSGKILLGSAFNVATDVFMSGDVTIGNTGVTTIGAGVITNTEIANGAGITFAKLANLTSGHLLVGSAGNVATDRAITGDVTISNTGVTAIAAGAIVDADISATAAIGFSKLANLNSGNILVGSAGNAATSVPMTGDVTISNTGATTIAALAVTGAKMAANTVTSSKLALNTIQYAIVPLTLVQFQDMYTTPVQIIAAPGAGNVVMVLGWYVSTTYGGTPISDGGNVVLQYGNTTHAGGTPAVEAIDATAFTTIAADTQAGSANGMGKGSNANLGVFISNATGAFTGGDASTFNVVVSYMVGAL